MHKDLQLALEQGVLHDLDLAVTRQVEVFLHELQENGFGSLDNSSLITRFD